MPIRILLADDNRAMLEMLASKLVQEGFEVVGQAEDGGGAIDLARTLQPDIAILDLVMPRMNGLDAARGIRPLCPATGVIILSAHSTAELVRDAFVTGARGYVVKSDNPDDVVRAIKEVAAGGIFLSPSVSRFVVQAYLPDIERY